MLSESLDIRPLTVKDVAAFKRLRLSAIADAPTAVWPTADEEAKRTREEVVARIEQTPAQVVLAAFSGAELVGIAGLRREPLIQVAHKATLWGVFVQPQFRKAGVARELLARIKACAQEMGAMQIHLCVNAENIRAKNLYRSIGFETFGLEPRAMRVGGRFYDEEHMWLLLADPSEKEY